MNEGWSGPYHFGAVAGPPPGWSVRWSENDGMWYAVRGDDADEGNTGVCFCSPWMARRHAIAIARGAVNSSVRQGKP